MASTYRPSILMRFNVLVTLASVALVLVWARAIDFRLPDAQATVPIVMIGVVFLLAGLFYSFVRVDERVAQSLLSLAVIQFFVPVAGVLTYLGARLQFPMVEPMLVAADGALGFDWVAMLHWAADKPLLISLANFFYHKPFFVLPYALILVLIFSNRGDRLEEMVGFVVISTTATVIIGSLAPGVSAYVWFAIPEDLAQTIGTPMGAASGVAHHAIRDGLENFVDLARPRALVAFPSYHTVVAVMLSLYSRHNRWLLALMLPFSVGITLSTPLIGGHYLVDTLGGIAMAFASFYGARWLAMRPQGQAAGANALVLAAGASR